MNPNFPVEHRASGGRGALLTGGLAVTCPFTVQKAFASVSGVSKMVVILESTLTCPECGHAKAETMPTDACQWFYECERCHAVLKPRPGDCCVYCSYGTVPCPPIQERGQGGCCGG